MLPARIALDLASKPDIAGECGFAEYVDGRPGGVCALEFASTIARRVEVSAYGCATMPYSKVTVLRLPMSSRAANPLGVLFAT
jgi:hypothetical protein